MSELTPAERIAAAQRQSVNPWEVEPATPPLSERLRQAADAIVELNSREGWTSHGAERAAVSPMYLRAEADRMDSE